MLPVLLSNGSTRRSSFFDDLPGIFDEFARAASTGGSVQVDRNGADVIEYNDRYEVVVDAAGVEKEQVDVEIEKGLLSVSITRTPLEVPEGARLLCEGRRAVDFSRKFKLTGASDEAAASLKNGVLTITVQKRPEQQPRKIEIR